MKGFTMTRALLGVSAAAAVWTAAVAQVPQQVFRAGTVFVNVDAYPRRDGRVVEGLTKADFEIKEDGKLQTVEAVEFVRVAPYAPEAELRDPNTVEDSYRQARDPRNRVFVILPRPVSHDTSWLLLRSRTAHRLSAAIDRSERFVRRPDARSPGDAPDLRAARRNAGLRSGAVLALGRGPQDADPAECCRRTTPGVRPDHRSGRSACPGVSQRNHGQQPRLARGAAGHTSRPAQICAPRD
jgi:hypothetical protein